MQGQPQLKIGIISDTHLPHRLYHLSPLIYHIFKDVDLILHAGDVDDIEHLTGLAELAPLYAVRGNIHFGDLSWAGKNLPEMVCIQAASRQIIIEHGHRPGIVGLLTKLPEIMFSGKLNRLMGGQLSLNGQIARRLHKRYPEADIIIFGHTHIPYYERIGKTICLNPGTTVADGRRMRTVGIIELWPTKIATHFIPLDHLGARQTELRRWTGDLSY